LSSPIVCVTGGAGFIGSHVCDRLVERGCRVVVVDNLSSGKRENLARHLDSGAVELIVADVAEGLDEPLAGRKPERYIHLAAQVSVIASIERPLDDVRINYRGTVQVLEHARAAGARKVVFSSSAAIYGDASVPPVREDAPALPVSPYGIDKYASELMLRYYAEVQQLPTTALRFFNVYGPRQDPTSPYSGVISIFASRARDGRDLTIFGDGEQTRDFVYVGDVSRIVVDAAFSEAGSGAVCNVGTGREITVNELAKTIVGLCGGKSQISHAPARAGEILRSYANVERAAQLFGFRANTTLADGLADLMAW
jgi:UDP-glucose 4-epimerase